jgi:ATP-dependent Lon protease
MNNTLMNQPNKETIPEVLSIIPTMDVVVFPNMIVPLLVLDEKIIKGVNQALEESKLVFLLAAKDSANSSEGAIGTNDLYQVGTIATIMRLIKIPEGGVKILVQGVGKGRARDIVNQGDVLQARIDPLEVEANDIETLLPHIRSIKAVAEKMATSGHSFSPDFHIILSKMQDPEKIADFVLSHLSLTVEQGQQLLEVQSQEELLETIYHYLHQEIEVAEIQEKIRSNAREAMNKAQKEYYLREQLKAIKQELGEDDVEEIEQMMEKLEALPVTDDVKEEVTRQINRLERTAPDSLEATVTRNYLEWIFALPWGNETEDNLDIKHAQRILDEDHHGLKDIKNRILDFISVRNLKQDGYAPILCFVGPPGTGKTSLGKSIAKSLGRAYSRISLGGVKDEAEIRGHRRTYVGAMPGRFIQAMRKAESANPLVVIDELDKLGSDFRGDPSAAMLEVLDPQQNNSFYDNYLGVPFDLSRIMFIATANNLDTIPGPLRDRLEIIELSGYTIEEKVHIAKKHLISKAIKDTGLDIEKISIDDDVIKDLANSYTRESGVRQLERLIRKLCSKAARSLVEDNEHVTFTLDNIEDYLGARVFVDEGLDSKDQIGISNGLAWTAYGGEILQIEAVLMPGIGKLMLTGQLGDVMKESAQAAVSYARSHADRFGIDLDAFKKNDLHIHVPAGAIPKDGPSAGITMLTAILSALTKRPINARYAMTGELNLRGDVMRIGGLKEKVLAAKRNNLGHVIAPMKNKPDLKDMDEITDGIEIIWVEHADEVLNRVLEPIKEK